MLKVLKLPGRVDYQAALLLQSNLVSRKLLNRPSEPDYLIILEHEPCFTVGRRCHSETPQSLTNSAIPFIKSPRGGKVTYHGPGQLTCYPIIDLKRKQSNLSLECYSQSLAAVMKDSLKDSFNIVDCNYDSSPGRVGLWLPNNRKIGFIGIQAQKWIVSHGFSLNMTKESLIGFEEIDPCGLKGQNVTITCIENEMTADSVMNSEYFCNQIVNNFIKSFNYKDEFS